MEEFPLRSSQQHSLVIAKESVNITQYSVPPLRPLAFLYSGRLLDSECLATVSVRVEPRLPTRNAHPSAALNRQLAGGFVNGGVRGVTARERTAVTERSRR